MTVLNKPSVDGLEAKEKLNSQQVQNLFKRKLKMKLRKVIKEILRQN